MASVGRVTHAVVARVPSSFMTAATVDGTCIDLERAREQQEALVKCLRGLDIDVLEMAPEESSPCSVFSKSPCHPWRPQPPQPGYRTSNISAAINRRLASKIKRQHSPQFTGRIHCIFLAYLRFIGFPS